MKKYITILGLTLLIYSNIYSQNINLNWVNQSTGDGNENISSAGADQNGNIYAIAYYSGDSMVFTGFTQKGHILMKEPPPFSRKPVDPVIVKMDKTGALIWKKQLNFIDTATACSFYPIHVDAAGNFTLYATVSGTAGMRLILGSDTISGNPQFWDSKIYSLMKFDSDGNILWHNETNWGQSFPSDVTSDAQGNTVLAGVFVNGVTSLKFDTFTVNLNPANAGKMEPLLVKYNNQGKVVWAKTFGGKFDDNVYTLSTDPLGNIYLTGQFQSDTFFIENKFVINTAGGGNDFTSPRECFVAKLNPAGEALTLEGIPYYPDFILNKNVYRKNEQGQSAYCHISGCPKNNQTVGTFTVNKGVVLSMINSNNGEVYYAANILDSTKVFNQKITNDSKGNIYVSFSFNTDSIRVAGQTLYNAGQGSNSKDYFILKIDTAQNVSLFLKGGGTEDDYIDYIKVTDDETLLIGTRYKSTGFKLDTIELINDDFPFYNMFLASVNIGEKNAGLTRAVHNEFINLYPNPASGIIHLDTRFNTGRYEIMNSTGVVVKSGTWDGSGSQVLNIEELAAGTYFIRAASVNKTAFSRFIKI